jgi:predicted Zn finger-like uncharacterized protein
VPIIQCDQCAAKLRLPEGSEGRTVRCPTCGHSFSAAAVPAAPAPADDEPSGYETVDERPRRSRRDDEDDDRRPASRRRSWDDDEEPRPRKKRKPKQSATYVNWKLIAGLSVVALGVMAGVIVLLVNVFSDTIPEDKWQVLEEPARFKVRMPGKAQRSSLAVPGPVAMEMVQHLVDVDRTTTFIVGYSEGSLPPARRALPADVLLNDSCDGSLAAIAPQKPIEKSRTSVRLGDYPGKQMVVDVTNRKVRMVARVYLVGERLYILMAVGKGYDPDNENVRRFFDSFEIIEAAPAPRPEQNRPGKKGFDDRPFEKPPVEKGGPPRRKPKGAGRQYEEADPSVLAPKDADPKLAPAGKAVFLSDLAEFGAKGFPAYWAFGKNGKVGLTLKPEAKVVVNGKNWEKGLGTIPENGTYARVCYSLGGRASTLEGAVALSEDEKDRPRSATRWLVLGDGKVLWRSQAIAEFGVTEDFKIDVANVNVLELRAYTEGPNHGCHAVWLDPRVMVKE